MEGLGGLHTADVKCDWGQGFHIVKLCFLQHGRFNKGLNRQQRLCSLKTDFQSSIWRNTSTLGQILLFVLKQKAGLPHEL